MKELKEFEKLDNETIIMIREYSNNFKDDNFLFNIDKLERYRYLLISNLSYSHAQAVYCDIMLNEDIPKYYDPCYDDYEEKIKELLIDHDNDKGGYDSFSGNTYYTIRNLMNGYLEECKSIVEEINAVDERIKSLENPEPKPAV